MADVLVFGSLNVDFVVKTPRRPAAGETVVGRSFQLFPGGKGANQAVAAAKAGAKVAMAGATGEDPFGDLLLRSIGGAGVDAGPVKVVPGVPTGSAFIVVDEAGENSIVVVPGANAFCSREYAIEMERVICAAKILMLQLEVPPEASETAAVLARRAGVTVFLDPAPPGEIPQRLWECLDVLTPNEHEAAALAGIEVKDFEDAQRAAMILLDRGPRRVIVKLGAKGAVAAQRDGSGKTKLTRCPAFQVPVVDTTAAGDAFSGALAAALSGGMSWDDALVFASAAGALAVTKPGAQTSLPSREEIDAFLSERRELLPSFWAERTDEPWRRGSR